MKSLQGKHSGASMLLSDDDERLLLEIFLWQNSVQSKNIQYQFQKRELFSNDEIEQLQIIAEKNQGKKD